MNPKDFKIWLIRPIHTPFGGEIAIGMYTANHSPDSGGLFIHLPGGEWYGPIRSDYWRKLTPLELLAGAAE